MNPGGSTGPYEGIGGRLLGGEAVGHLVLRCPVFCEQGTATVGAVNTSLVALWDASVGVSMLLGCGAVVVEVMADYIRARLHAVAETFNSSSTLR